ncbi:MAG: carboxypeptidase-like regulatory domain-containing protein [Acidimicrobiales bacterium]
MTGVVRDKTAPVAGATVRLEPVAVTAITDAAGRYALTGLLPGTYSLTANAFGFQPTAVALGALKRTAWWTGRWWRPRPGSERRARSRGTRRARRWRERR